MANLSGARIPGGNNKGKTIEQEGVEVSDIEFWLRKKQEAIDSDPNGQYAASNRKWIAAGQAELQRRASGGTLYQEPTAERPVQHPTQALARTHASSVVVFEGSFSNATRATEALRAASEKCYLVSPAPVCGNLPDGCELAISMVQVDPDGRELYAITGNKKQPSEEDIVGLDKTSLAKIASAAGITWEISRRTDDGSDPRYCSWEAVGVVRMFDGQVRRLPGNVEIDARDGSPLIDEIRTKSDRKRQQYPQDKNDGGDSQILELRKFLQRHAESKAMNRAIANLGIRRSYKRSELRKPFAVARIMFTGRSDDPEARREYRQMIGQAFMGGTAALYGGNVRAPALTATHDAPQLNPPPPPRSVPIDDDAYTTEGYDPMSDFGSDEKV